MRSFLFPPFLLFAIIGGFVDGLKDSDLVGTWTTSCEEAYNTGGRYVCDAKETFYPDGSFESISEFRIYWPNDQGVAAQGTGVERGTWQVVNNRLRKDYTSVDLVEYASELPNLSREAYEQQIAQGMQSPEWFYAKLVSDSKIVVFSDLAKIAYKMRRSE